MLLAAHGLDVIRNKKTVDQLIAHSSINVPSQLVCILYYPCNCYMHSGSHLMLYSSIEYPTYFHVSLKSKAIFYTSLYILTLVVSYHAYCHTILVSNCSFTYINITFIAAYNEWQVDSKHSQNKIDSAQSRLHAFCRRVSADRCH